MSVENINNLQFRIYRDGTYDPVFIADTTINQAPTNPSNNAILFDVKKGVYLNRDIEATNEYSDFESPYNNPFVEVNNNYYNLFLASSGWERSERILFKINGYRNLSGILAVRNGFSISGKFSVIGIDSNGLEKVIYEANISPKNSPQNINVNISGYDKIKVIFPKKRGIVLANPKVE